MITGKSKPADVQYHGQDGITQTRIDAIVRIIQSGVWITRVRLLTCEERHCFYLELSELQDILIRSGFASGYPGQGPAGLAIALLLFERHRIDVEEVLISKDLMDKVAESRITRRDLEMIRESNVVRPWRLSDYTYGVLSGRGGDRAETVRQYPLMLPFGLLDDRLWDLALTLHEDSDSAIYKACRALEERVAKRIGSSLHGRALYRKAFHGPNSFLVWEDLRQPEADGRAELFMGVNASVRNPRAHRDPKTSRALALREFLLVNELFLLEAEAVSRLS